MATETSFLKGYSEEGIVFLKSTGDGNGIDDICCADCGKNVYGDFEIEFL